MRNHVAMDEAFIIMQIGDVSLESVCDDAIIPAIEAAGFAPRRVDWHNAGDLLKSEIVQFLERSQILVADLTNERPNCYLEIGYAMGLGKKANLILTAREDHHHSSPNFQPNGPRVHFDLEGYDILFWSPSDLPAFRDELAKRIKRRASIIQSSAPDTVPLGDTGWRDKLRTHAIEGLEGIDCHAYMEIVSTLSPAGNWAQQKLRDAVREAQVHTFGWPIAITLDNRDEYRPRPTTDGIVADIAIGTDMMRKSYDFWKLLRDGRFYTLLSLFEDEHRPNTICWDIRTVRVTESLLFLTRLYRRLDASDTDEVVVSIQHGGLANRSLSVADSTRFMTDSPPTSEDVVEQTITASLIDLEVNITNYMIQIIDPLLVVFDFYKVSDQILTDVAEGFIFDRRKAA